MKKKTANRWIILCAVMVLCLFVGLFIKIYPVSWMAFTQNILRAGIFMVIAFLLGYIVSRYSSVGLPKWLKTVFLSFVIISIISYIPLIIYLINRDTSYMIWNTIVSVSGKIVFDTHSVSYTGFMIGALVADKLGRKD